jgi:hypothetical protein
VKSQVEFPAHHSNCNINRQRVSEMQVLEIYSSLLVLWLLWYCLSINPVPITVAMVRVVEMFNLYKRRRA